MFTRLRGLPCGFVQKASTALGCDSPGYFPFILFEGGKCYKNELRN